MGSVSIQTSRVKEGVVMPREFTSFTALFTTMEEDVHVTIARSRKIMKKAGNLVKQHARAQLGHYLDHPGPYRGEPWAPLAESTLKRKLHDTPLVETGKLHDSIEVTAVDGEVEIGVKSSIGERGIDIGDIAVWQEFGTIRIPPRPFLGPALHEEQKGIKEIIAAGLFVEIIRRR
jgi:HK97 gp10 family phage protein